VTGPRLERLINRAAVGVGGARTLIGGGSGSLDLWAEGAISRVSAADPCPTLEAAGTVDGPSGAGSEGGNHGHLVPIREEFA
jgi:hypothetical protein